MKNCPSVFVWLWTDIPATINSFSPLIVQVQWAGTCRLIEWRVPASPTQFPQTLRIPASYAKRYELFCQKLVREQLYDCSCLLLTDRSTGPMGRFREPSAELRFERFVGALTGHAIGYLKSRTGR
ncbi:MAG: hypothetical protein HYT87_08840 [Nitrospirae bacterium]|nr:hypothetical protein [Nitrospirota bacterium]